MVVDNPPPPQANQPTTTEQAVTTVTQAAVITTAPVTTAGGDPFMLGARSVEPRRQFTPQVSQMHNPIGTPPLSKSPVFGAANFPENPANPGANGGVGGLGEDQDGGLGLHHATGGMGFGPPMGGNRVQALEDELAAFRLQEEQDRRERRILQQQIIQLQKQLGATTGARPKGPTSEPDGAPRMDSQVPDLFGLGGGQNSTVNAARAQTTSIEGSQLGTMGYSVKNNVGMFMGEQKAARGAYGGVTTTVQLVPNSLPATTVHQQNPGHNGLHHQQGFYAPVSTTHQSQAQHFIQSTPTRVPVSYGVDVSAFDPLQRDSSAMGHVNNHTGISHPPTPPPPHLNSSTESQRRKSFKMEKPLTTFDGTKGPEELEKFIRMFEFYVQSREGAEPYALRIIESWLESTPLLVFQQFLRDQPFGSYSDFKLTLERNFGQPIDCRRAVHMLQQVKWQSGQSLIQLATHIRELHYRAHPTTVLAERESYAGDTFIRCLPEKWQIKLRSLGGCTLVEYLDAATELQNTEKHRRELQGDSSMFPGTTLQVQHGSPLNIPSRDQVPVVQNCGSPQGASGSSPIRDQTMECFFCRNIGHRKKDCLKYKMWKQKKEQEQQTSQGTNEPGQTSRIKPGEVTGGSKSSVEEFLHCRVMNSGSSGLSGPAVYCPMGIEGSRVEALVDSGSTPTIVSANFIKRVATTDRCKKELLSRLRKVDRKFYGYGKKEIHDFKVWLPLDMEMDGVKARIPCVVDEGQDPECEVLLGTLAMIALGFKILIPGGVDLLEYFAVKNSAMIPEYLMPESMKLILAKLSSVDAGKRLEGAAPVGSSRHDGKSPSPQEMSSVGQGPAGHTHQVPVEQPARRILQVELGSRHTIASLDSRFMQFKASGDQAAEEKVAQVRKKSHRRKITKPHEATGKRDGWRTVEPPAHPQPTSVSLGAGSAPPGSGGGVIGHPGQTAGRGISSTTKLQAKGGTQSSTCPDHRHLCLRQALWLVVCALAGFHLGPSMALVGWAKETRDLFNFNWVYPSVGACSPCPPRGKLKSLLLRLHTAAISTRRWVSQLGALGISWVGSFGTKAFGGSLRPGHRGQSGSMVSISFSGSTKGNFKSKM